MCLTTIRKVNFSKGLVFYIHCHRAFFNIYTGGAKAPPPPPPAPMLAPPLKGFGPPSNVPFCLKISEYHAEIAGNQV